jgi:hydroxymethylbilane synthase
LIDTDVMIPACSQGAIAIEIRENDAFIEEILSKINDTETMITTSAERAFLKTLEGGCQIPVGSYSYIKDGQFHITGFISDIDGQRFLKETAMAPVEQAVVISASMARKLYSLGGKEILESIRQYSMPQAQSNLPLQDKVIISTRAIETTDTLPELLKAMGARVVSLPMIEIVMTQTSEEEKELFQQIDQFDWIFFTSKNGVANFFKQLIDVKGSTELARHIKKAVIGSKTAAELEYYGYAPDFMSKGNTSEEMLEQFYQEYQPINQNILLALGKLADDTLIKRLSKENRVERINVYDTVKPQNADAKVLESITQDKYDLVVFTSPSTFHNLCSFYETDEISMLKMASIGGTTTKAIQEAGLEPLITAKKSNVEGLCDAIIDYFKK